MQCDKPLYGVGEFVVVSFVFVFLVYSFHIFCSRRVSGALSNNVLVQSDSTTGEPLLLHSMLLQCITSAPVGRRTWAFLLITQVESYLVLLLQFLSNCLKASVYNTENLH